MPKATIFVILILAICVVPANAQSVLSFNLVDSFQLPGGSISDLNIEDMNSDGIYDYVYRKSSHVYFVDGLTMEEITIELEHPVEIMRIGDINNDSIQDIAIYYLNEGPPDTNIIYFYFGPEYNTFITLPIILYNNNEWHYSILEIEILGFGGDNYAVIGIREHYQFWSENYSYTRTGGWIEIHHYNNNQFEFVDGINLNGEPNSINPYQDGSNHCILTQSMGIEEAIYDVGGEPDVDCLRRWSDLIEVYSSGYANIIWHVPDPIGDFYWGNIEDVFVGSPMNDGYDLVYFNAYSRHNNQWDYNSFFCYSAFADSIIWNHENQYNNRYFILTRILEHEYKDFLIFNNSSFLICDPYNGYIYETGVIQGIQGYYKTTLDREGDGIDEFYYLSGDSVFIYNIGSLTSIDDNFPNSSMPINLFINYPNPFNSQTCIQFNLIRESHVKLEIYNLLGQSVEVLIDRSLEAGTYSIDWNASNLPSGVYFSKITTKEYSKTKEMVLIK